MSFQLGLKRKVWINILISNILYYGNNYPQTLNHIIRECKYYLNLLRFPNFSAS